MSSILYHVHNIYTIKYAENRRPYNCVQIILEEIEQYYHPEYQRVLIATLIEYLNKLNIDKNFRIDILLVTHSPFVLSDIPMENILFRTRQVCHVRSKRETERIFWSQYV